MKCKTCTWLLICMCAATFVWQSDASTAQQFPSQQYEPIEIIPFRPSGGQAAFGSPLARAPLQEGSGNRNFDPRFEAHEAFGPRQGYEYRRPYRANYQGEPSGPEAGRAYEGNVYQRSDGSQPGGSGSRGHGGCRGGCHGGRGYQAHRRNGSPDQRPYDLRPREQRQFDQRPYDDRQYNEEADVSPSLSSFSPRDAARQWRNYPFPLGQR